MMKEINKCCGQVFGHTRWCRAVAAPGLVHVVTGNSASQVLADAVLQDTSAGKQWMQTFTKKKFFPLDPQLEDICIEDIAHQLAQNCRYGGACKNFYSVAQHSVMAAATYPVELRSLKLAALLHDASETYLGDVKGPIKHHPIFDGYRAAARHLQNLINIKFGLPPGADHAVKHADVEMYLREVHCAELMAPRHPEWKVDAPDQPFGPQFRTWGPNVAEAFFLKAFQNLYYAGGDYETDFMQSGQAAA